MLSDEWRHRPKFQPSLFGHLRRTHVSSALGEMQRRCAYEMRTRKKGDDASWTRFRDALDDHVRRVVWRAYRDLDAVYDRLVRLPLWRRLILWSRARVAARRVLLRRSTFAPSPTPRRTERACTAEG